MLTAKAIVKLLRLIELEIQNTTAMVTLLKDLGKTRESKVFHQRVRTMKKIFHEFEQEVNRDSS